MPRVRNARTPRRKSDPFRRAFWDALYGTTFLAKARCAADLEIPSLRAA